MTGWQLFALGGGIAAAIGFIAAGFGFRILRKMEKEQHQN